MVDTPSNDPRSPGEVLAEQRRSLLAGELGDLARMIEDLEAMSARLSGGGIEERELAALREQARRNGEILLASARGVRAVRRRLKELSEAGSSMQTYTSAGRREALPQGPASKGRTV